MVWNEGLVGIIERNVHKGDKVQVRGAIKTRKWQDKDGRDRYSTEIVLKGYGCELQLLSPKREGSSQQTTSRQAPPRSPQHQDMDDEIPF